MKAALAALACSGCATSWIVLEASGAQRGLDEHVREELVPLPGIDERLAVTVPLAIEYTLITDPTTHVTSQGPAKPFAIACSVEQRGRSSRYHAAFRYGGDWKKATAISFFVESALASLLLLTAADHPNNYVYGGFFAADAAITGAIFFIPRREIYREDAISVTTPMRTDCPDGLALAIGAATYPIDAAGHIGELGDAALDEWMTSPAGAVRVTFQAQALDLPIGYGGQCRWRLDHHQDARGCTGEPQRVAAVTFSLAAGTLAQR